MLTMIDITMHSIIPFVMLEGISAVLYVGYCMVDLVKFGFGDVKPRM